MTNWQEYETGLRRRGSLTLWLTPEALLWRSPRRKARGGPPLFRSGDRDGLDGLVFGRRLRQTEGLVESVLSLTGLKLAAPHHTKLSRRARICLLLGSSDIPVKFRTKLCISSSTAPAFRSTRTRHPVFCRILHCIQGLLRRARPLERTACPRRRYDRHPRPRRRDGLAAHRPARRSPRRRFLIADADPPLASSGGS